MTPDKLPLTILLLKPEQVDQAKRILSAIGSVVPLRAPYTGYVVSFPTPGNVPPWITSLKSVVQDPELVSGANFSPSAIMVVRQSGHTFALSFGRAYHRLNSDWFYPDFGLKVALNGIKPSKIREIHAEQVFARWHTSTESAPRAAAVEAFGVEFDRDLVARIAGESATKTLGTKIAGAESLRIEASFSTFPSILDKTIALYRSRSYRNNFPEIDNLEVVTVPPTVQKLNEKLEAALVPRDAEKNIVMLTPTRNLDQVVGTASYVVGRKGRNPVTIPFLRVNAWKSLLQAAGLPATALQAKGTPIHFLDVNRETVFKSNVFDCFGYETEFRGKTYVLSGGVWYSVARNFIKDTNKAVRKIAAPRTPLAAWNEVESEEDYNQRCGERDGFVNFDRLPLRHGGGQSQFEFCDILHLESRTLYFVKNGSRSSGMSHLYE